VGSNAARESGFVAITGRTGKADIQGKVSHHQPSGDGEYASKSTLTGGTINPLAFPDVAVSVDAIVSI
jgi:hypothetical protein